MLLCLRLSSYVASKVYQGYFIDNCLGGVNMREAEIYNKKHYKQKYYPESGRCERVGGGSFLNWRYLSQDGERKNITAVKLHLSHFMSEN